MKNKLNIDKYLNDYKESLPNVYHTEVEDITLVNSILSKANKSTSSNVKITSEHRIGNVLEFIRNLVKKDAFRYSFGFAAILVGVGICLLYNYKASKVVTPTHPFVNKQPLEKTEHESEKLNEKTIKTTLLASIDCDTYRRGGESPIDKKVIFGIIT